MAARVVGKIMAECKVSACKFPIGTFVMFGLAVIAMLSSAGAEDILAPLGETKPVEVTIVSTEFNYMPKTVRVTAGRAVTLILDNSGAETEHGIDLPTFDFHLRARLGEVVRRTFVFNKPGKYIFNCDLPGHTEAGMNGTLVVGAF